MRTENTVVKAWNKAINDKQIGENLFIILTMGFNKQVINLDVS